MSTAAPPNVVVIIMDDLAYGDLACHGNPWTRTPNLDRMHSQGTRFTQTCSGPVCTPARAMLMTGRYAYRTRAIDTYCGRTTIDPGEVTLAQVLRGRGYATCLSGKWHLGDTAPSRPQEMGFDEVLMHGGGGLRQPCNDGHWDGWDAYQDPYLTHNGRGKKFAGYCTDIYTDHAIEFVRTHRGKPFFLYLATNAPHSPFEVPDQWLERYRGIDLPDKFKRIYAMVDNIDHNVGRLQQALIDLGIHDNTIVIFTSDHGPCGSAVHEGVSRFNCGLRSIKGTPFEGGVRVPLFWQWPGRLKPGREIDRVVSPIDFLPTLAAICGATPPGDRKIDGTDLSPLLLGTVSPSQWPDRHVFLQWHRGDVPRPYTNSLCRTQQYKLVDGARLFDLQNDPGETTNIAPRHHGLVAQMRRAYEAWFADVSSERPDNFAPVGIQAGGASENPVLLNRNDRRSHGADGWIEDATHGHWEVEFLGEPGSRYDFTVDFRPAESDANLLLMVGSQCFRSAVTRGDRACRFPGVAIPPGRSRVEAILYDGGNEYGARYVRVLLDNGIRKA